MNSPKLSEKLRYLPKIFEDNNLTRKAFLNAIASGLDYLAKVIVAFVLTPMMVIGLGDYLYGIWQFLLRIVGYMSPATGRPTQALKFVLAKNQSSNDFDQKRTYIGSTFKVLILFSPLLIIPGMLVSWFIPIWLKTSAELVWIVRITCALLVCNLILITLVAIPQAIMEGENKSYKRMGFATLLIFLGGGFTWLALFLNSGVIGIAVAAIALSLIQLIFYFLIVRKYIPWFGISKSNKHVVRDFLKLSGWFMAWNLIIQLMTSSDVIILGLINSVESITYYAISKFAPETIVTLVSMMVIGVLPGLGGIIGSGDLKKARLVRQEIMLLSWIVITVFGTEILLWNRSFISIWVGDEYYVGMINNLLIVISVFQFIIIRNDANVIDISLDLKQKVILGGVSVLLSITAAVVIATIFEIGISGVLLGIMIGRLILSFMYPKIVGKILLISIKNQLISVIRPVVVTFLLLLFACIIEGFIPSNNWHGFSGWFYLTSSVLTTSALIAILSFYLGLTANQQKAILSRIGILVKGNLNKN